MYSILQKCITLLDILITHPLFLLSLFFPRDKQLWVFIGWHNSPEGEIFADNTKYLFLHTHQNAPAIKAVWLAKDRKLAQTLRSRGYNAYYQHSVRGMWYALRAGFTFIDAYLQRHNFRLSGRSKIVQLLHGKGMKKGGYAKRQYRKQHYIFGPSQFALDLLPDTFTRGSKLFVTGYPRSDLFFKKIPDSDISADLATIQKINELKKKNIRTVLYAPTYRRGMPHFDIKKVLNLTGLLPELKKNNVVLFVSLHPKYRAQERDVQMNGLHFLGEQDVQVLLPHIDLLIADYSSIFTDFLLLDKPLVFFPFDKNRYEKKEGFCVDYDQVTPGEKIYEKDKLPGAIQDALEKDVWKEKRAEVKDKYHAYYDGNASTRILEILAKEEDVTLR